MALMHDTHGGHRARGVVKLLDMVFPDGLFEGIPLGQGRGMDSSNPVTAESTGAGHPMKAIPGVKVGANQVAQQGSFPSLGCPKKLF